jgi:hypothetical protein
MFYHSHYSDETFIGKNEYSNSTLSGERFRLIKQAGINVTGSVWVKDLGWTLLMEGPSLSEDDQNLLNLKECTPEELKSVELGEK